MNKKKTSVACWACIGRVLDDVWTAVTGHRSEQSPITGTNSHQLRDKTVCLDLGKPQHAPGDARYSNSAYAETNRSNGFRRNVNWHRDWSNAAVAAAVSFSRAPTLLLELAPDKLAASLAAAAAARAAALAVFVFRKGSVGEPRVGRFSYSG